jgi:hypothetical protein
MELNYWRKNIIFRHLIFFLSKPVYHWTVAGVPLVIRIPQYEKPWYRWNNVCVSECSETFFGRFTLLLRPSRVVHGSRVWNSDINRVSASSSDPVMSDKCSCSDIWFSDAGRPAGANMSWTTLFLYVWCGRSTAPWHAYRLHYLRSRSMLCNFPWAVSPCGRHIARSIMPVYTQLSRTPSSIG